MDTQKTKTEQGMRAYDEAQVEALLARTLAPQPPPECLRRQVRKRVAVAWERRPLTLGQRVRGLLRMSAYQRTWAAIAVLAVLAIVGVFMLPSNGAPIAGTVMGNTATVAAVLAALAVIIAIVAWFFHKHRN